MQKQILESIEKARAEGKTDAQILQELAQRGWSDADISKALSSAAPEAPAGVPGTPAVPQTEALFSSTSGSGKKLLGLSSRAVLTGGILAAIAVLGGGVFAYNQVFAKPPSEILRLAFEKGVTSFSYDGDISFSIEPHEHGNGHGGGPVSLRDPLPAIVPFLGVKQRATAMVSSSIFKKLVASVRRPESAAGGSGAGEERLTVSADISGAIDAQAGQEKESFSGDFSVELPETFAGEELGGGTFSVSVDAVSLTADKELYLKFSDLELPSDIQDLLDEDPASSEILDEILGVWIFFDEDTLKEYELEMSEDTDYTPEENERLKTSFLAALILEKLEGEKIDGASTYHYGMKLDRTGAEAFLRELVSIEEGRAGVQDLEELLEDEDFEKMFTDFVNGFAGEIWISKKDLFIRKFTFSAAFETEGDEEIDLDPYALSLDMTMAFSRFNEPVTLTAPDDSVPINDLVESFLGGSQSQNRDYERIGDLGSLAAALELYRDRSGSYPSTGDALVQTHALSTPCRELIEQDLLSTCPTDPAGEPAWYGYTSDGTDYTLSAVLEDSMCSFYGATWEGGLCFYKITSP